MLANTCVESHLRALLEQGFEVAVAKDATAAPKHPEWGYGSNRVTILWVCAILDEGGLRNYLRGIT
jgi:nicotinamidase-related amidase